MYLLDGLFICMWILTTWLMRIMSNHKNNCKKNPSKNSINMNCISSQSQLMTQENEQLQDVFLTWRNVALRGLYPSSQSDHRQPSASQSICCLVPMNRIYQGQIWTIPNIFGKKHTAKAWQIPPLSLTLDFCSVFVVITTGKIHLSLSLLF